MLIDECIRARTDLSEHSAVHVLCSVCGGMQCVYVSLQGALAAQADLRQARLQVRLQEQEAAPQEA